MGDVIDLRARRAPRNEPADAARARIVAAVRAAGGREQLARDLTVRLGRKVHASTVRAWETQVTPPADVLLAAEDVTGRGKPAGDHVAVMRAFRAADLRMGGGHVYRQVLDHLHTAVAPQLLAGDSGRQVFTAAAGLVEMAGWSAHDSGDDTAAGAHFARSLDLAGLGDDRQLLVHVLASLAHLADHRGDTTAAAGYAARGREELAAGPPVPELDARLSAMQARVAAATGRARECTTLLLAAERALDRRPVVARSEWVSHFDEASLAVEAARCMRRIGDWTETERQARTVIQHRPAGTRAWAFGELLRASALAGQGRVDDATAAARAVAAGRIGSALVAREMVMVHGQLRGDHAG